MPVILLEFSMTPLSKGKSVSKYVARSLDIIDKSGLDYRMNPHFLLFSIFYLFYHFLPLDKL